LWSAAPANLAALAEGVRHSHAVGRATNAETGSIQDMRVDHRRRDVVVAEELLHCPDVEPPSMKWVANECLTAMGRRAFRDLAGLRMVVTREGLEP